MSKIRNQVSSCFNKFMVQKIKIISYPNKYDNSLYIKLPRIGLSFWFNDPDGSLLKDMNWYINTCENISSDRDIIFASVDNIGK